MTEDGLNEGDVRRLLDNPSAGARVETAAKLAEEFDKGAFSTSERHMAEEIFRLMLHDAEVRVRQALSVHLKENSNLPHDVAMALAGDVDVVALPMLQYSDVLTADDLVAIVRSHGPEQQKAVARRHKVDSAVADALVDVGSEEVVAELVANSGADLADPTLERVVERFGDRPAVQDPLIHRPKLPITVTERLVTRLSEGLREHLLAAHDLPSGVAAQLVVQTRERATINLSAESTDNEVDALIKHLRLNQRLTPSIILRAVCMGDMKFFEYSLANLVGISIVNARTLIHDSGDLGLQAIYAKAKLPPSYFQAARAAIDVARETQFDGEANDLERHQRRTIERILTQYGDLGVDFENDDLEYLLTKMGQLPLAHS